MQEPSICFSDSEFLRRRIFARFYRCYGEEVKISTGTYVYHDDGEFYDVSLSLDAQVERALLNDDKDDFVYCIDGFYESAKDVPSWILEQIFVLDSVNCFTAVQNGETGSKFCFDTLEEFCGCSRLPLLHLAAFFSSLKIAKWLLASGVGATPNDRCETDIYGLKDLLPLKCALLAGRPSEKIKSTMEDSVFTIISILSMHDKRKHMELVRLLVERTDNVKDHFFNTVKEGELTDVATFLLVAHQKLMPLYISKNVYGLASAGKEINIYDFVAKEIALIDFRQKKSLYTDVDNEVLQMWKDKKVKMKKMLLLFGIFDRLGYRLTATLQLDADVSDFTLGSMIARIFKLAGLPLKIRSIDMPSGGGCANLLLLHKILNVGKDKVNSLKVFGYEENKNFKGCNMGISKIQSPHLWCKQEAPVGISGGRSSYHTLAFMGGSREIGFAAQPKIASNMVVPNARFTKHCSFLLTTMKRASVCCSFSLAPAAFKLFVDM